MATSDARYATGRETHGARTNAQTAALVVGVVFLLVGILGFIPGVTTNYDDMTFAGHDTSTELLGVFKVSILHNLVHLAFGVVGIIAARSFRWAKWYLIGGGVVYLVLWVYGLAIDHDSDANFVPVNDADNWLHLALGVGMIALGLLPERRRAVSERRA
jgi:arginine exporter protein ArgO